MYRLYGHSDHLKTLPRTANKVLPQAGVTCLKSSSVFQINFSAGLTVLCPEIPHERQAQKRYRSCYDDTQTKTNDE